MVRSTWTVSNFLSLSRVMLLVPILYFLLNPGSENRVIASCLMVAASLTDFLDGRIARRYNQETEFGRILDPLADKICAGAVVIVLSALGDIPGWFVPSVIGRDIVILLGGLYIAKAKKVILHSNWAGKMAMGVVAVFLIIATLRLEALEMIKLILLWGSTFFLAYSLLAYAKRFYDMVLARRQVAE